jgi:hypothetical protein
MPGSLTRFGPTKRNGDTRFDHTGSSRILTQSVSACWRGRHMKCARSRLQPVPGDDRRMATAPKPATSPWGRAIDGLRANAADPACFSAVRPVGRKNARRRNDWIWGHCNSVTSRSYYTAMRPRPTLTSTASASGSGFFRSRREVGTAFPACPRAKPNRDWRSRLRLISSAMISRRAQEDGACG